MPPAVAAVGGCKGCGCLVAGDFSGAMRGSWGVRSAQKKVRLFEIFGPNLAQSARILATKPSCTGPFLNLRFSSNALIYIDY
jgi:hypothetical protein